MRAGVSRKDGGGGCWAINFLDCSVIGKLNRGPHLSLIGKKYSARTKYSIIKILSKQKTKFVHLDPILSLKMKKCSTKIKCSIGTKVKKKICLNFQEEKRKKKANWAARTTSGKKIKKVRSEQKN